MKISLISGLVVAALLPLSGCAAAATTGYPIKGQELTKNALYESGALPKTECAEKSIKRNNRTSGKAYVDGVLACLNTTWEQHLTAAGVTFTKPRVKYVTKMPKKYCGRTMPKDNSQAYY